MQKIATKINRAPKYYMVKIDNLCAYSYYNEWKNNLYSKPYKSYKGKMERRICTRCLLREMACIAQLINVLQSVILTDGEKMIKTPTYHVFHMYRHHQGASLLSSELLLAGTVGTGDNELPKVFESVSVDADGIITITLTNNSLESAECVDVQLTADAAAYNVAEASYVSGAMNAHNTFEAPDVVTERAFGAYEKTADGIRVELPACSVVSIRLKK